MSHRANKRGSIRNYYLMKYLIYSFHYRLITKQVLDWPGASRWALGMSRDNFPHIFHFLPRVVRLNN